MAGSYNHVVNDEGKLFDIYGVSAMNDTMGDVFETIEEMYGMIWYLASIAVGPAAAPGAVEAARQEYKKGLEASPGTGAQLPDEELNG